MTTTRVPAAARAAVQLRHRREIDDLDYRRQLRQLSGRYTQRQIATWLGIAQPSVSAALKAAEQVAMPVEGFSGATPMEICERFAAGVIDRRQLEDELARFPYAERGTSDGYDGLVVDPPGTWAEVSAAVRRGLIDDDIYEVVFNRRHGL